MLNLRGAVDNAARIPQWRIQAPGRWRGLLIGGDCTGPASR